MILIPEANPALAKNWANTRPPSTTVRINRMTSSSSKLISGSNDIVYFSNLIPKTRSHEQLVGLADLVDARSQDGLRRRHGRPRVWPQRGTPRPKPPSCTLQSSRTRRTWSRSFCSGLTWLFWFPQNPGFFPNGAGHLGSAAGLHMMAAQGGYGGHILPGGHHHHDGSSGGGEATRKRQVRLQKNREAARECRRKKKEYIKCLENRVAVLEVSSILFWEFNLRSFHSWKNQ